MNAQLLKESNNEKIVAPIIRNLKSKLNIKAAMVQMKRNIPKNPKILGVFSKVQKKTFSGFDLINFLYFVSLLYFWALT